MKRNRAAGAASFSAEVKVADINPCVDVPDRVVASLGGDKKLAVLVKVSGERSKANDACPPPRPGRLARDAARLEAIGRLTPGDWFRSTLVPQALAANGRAREAWERLAPSRRREILTYLNFLKTPAALERNMQKTIAELVAGTGAKTWPRSSS